MSDFAGMEDMLQDFLTEASDLLSGVDNKLDDLEKHPDDKALLNEIFRGFHTIKGGAGFLGLEPLVEAHDERDEPEDQQRARTPFLEAGEQMAELEPPPERERVAAQQQPGDEHRPQ